MRFKDTYRFSPIVHGYDIPWERDLFHKGPEEIPTNSKEYNMFCNDENIIIDTEWWNKQYNRCMNGFMVTDAVEPGGDAIVDELDAIWSDVDKERYYEPDKIIIPKNSVYLPNYKKLIVDRTLHITNRHYWYLNFWKIYRLDYNKGVKDVLPPRFLDLDYLFFRRIEMMVEQQRDGSEGKSRQQGASEKMAGGIMGWNYHFVHSSTNIIAGGMSDDAEHTMDNFTRGARDLINTQFYKIRSRSSADYYKSKYFGSEVLVISCKDNSQALARFSPYWVLLEEVGKWKAGLVLDTKGFITPALQAENRKTGWMHFVGTGGDMDQGAQDMEELHYNPEKYNLVSYENRWDRDNTEVSRTGHFMKDTMFKVIDDDGNSLVIESEKVWDAHYEKLSGKDKYNFTTQHARFASDAFLIQSGGYFGEEIANWCNERISYIRTHRAAQTVERGFLSWQERSNWSKGVYWTPDMDGPFMISEHPELDSDDNTYMNLYKVGTDSYDQDEAYTSSSKGACWVKKTFLNADRTYNKYVAGIVERPTVAEGGREVFYEHTALLTAYYGAQNLIEHSNLLIFEWYERKGLHGLLKEKPEFVIAKMVNKSGSLNQYGIDPSTKPHWLRIHADWLRNKDNIDKCDFIELMQAWAKFKYRPGMERYNCDITISSSLCSVMENDEVHYNVASRSESNRVVRLPRYRTIDGELKLVI